MRLASGQDRAAEDCPPAASPTRDVARAERPAPLRPSGFRRSPRGGVPLQAFVSTGSTRCSDRASVSREVAEAPGGTLGCAQAFFISMRQRSLSPGCSQVKRVFCVGYCAEQQAAKSQMPGIGVLHATHEFGMPVGARCRQVLRRAIELRRFDRAGFVGHFRLCPVRESRHARRGSILLR